MPVIRQEQAAHSTVRHQQFRLGDFVIEGRQIIEAAQRKADEILQHARAEAERIKEQAAVQGREEGTRQGREEGTKAGHTEAVEKATAEFEAEHAQLASACEAQFREIERRKRDLLLAAHRDLLVLAVAIAERVTKRIGLIDREAVCENLAGVLDLVGSASDLVVEVNPDDVETLERFAPDLIAHRSDLKHVEVQKNESVAPGGCIVRTRGGRIDATLETQLERIARELVPGGRDLTPAEQDTDETSETS